MTPRTPSPEMYDLLYQAAELRSAGKSWAAVADKLDREEPTCRNWPCIYRTYWQRLLAVVESHAVLEAGAEARVPRRGHSGRNEEDEQ